MESCNIIFLKLYKCSNDYGNLTASLASRCFCSNDLVKGLARAIQSFYVSVMYYYYNWEKIQGDPDALSITIQIL